MTTMLVVVILAAALAYVLYPLHAACAFAAVEEDADAHLLDVLNKKKTTVYENIKDLEFEYQMGKLSQEDFAALGREYRTEAANLLKKIDMLRDSANVAAMIEKDVQTRRNGKTAVQADAFCTRCGHLSQAGLRFCTNCGARR